MTVEDRVRHERLRALLPRTYATDPRDSVLGALLDALADGLRSFDRATERALRDKWVATAAPHRKPEPEPPYSWLEIALAGEPEPLERLGSLLDLLRQPWELDEQAYRRRITLWGPLMARGLATSRSILMFAVSALGSEPCPGLDHVDDTTTAFGFEAWRVARCRACRGGREIPTGPCPLREDATLTERITMSLVDNPRVAMRVSRASVRPDSSGRATIRFENNSLFPDRPEIEITLPPSLAGPVVPSFRSRQTGELVVVLHALEPGQTLSILPRSPHDASQPHHLQEWVDRPTGSSPPSSVVRINGVTTTVPVLVFPRPGFDQARLDEASFLPDAPGALEVTTPAVVPGNNTWDYMPLRPDEVLAAVAELPAVVPPAVEMPDLQPVAVRLRWWARPIAHFSIRIPPNDTVRAAVDGGRIGYLRRMLERTRPVGVTFLIELPEPPFRDALDPTDTEIATTEDWPAVGAFDVSIFDFSLLSE